MPSQIIRLQDGSQIELDEWLHWAVYSSVEFAGQTKVDLRAFTYVQGQQVPSVGLPRRTATLSDTNQIAKNRTNQDEELIVFGLTFEIFGLDNANVDPTVFPAGPGPYASQTPNVSRHNLRVLQRDMMCEYIVGAKITKPQMRAPLAYLNQSVGVFGHGTANGALGGTPDTASAGRISANNQWKFELPIRVEPDRIMYLRLYSQQKMADLNGSIGMRWYLDSLRRRPFG